MNAPLIICLPDVSYGHTGSTSEGCLRPAIFFLRSWSWLYATRSEDILILAVHSPARLLISTKCLQAQKNNNTNSKCNFWGSKHSFWYVYIFYQNFYPKKHQNKVTTRVMFNVLTKKIWSLWDGLLLARTRGRGMIHLVETLVYYVGFRRRQVSIFLQIRNIFY